MDNLYWLDQIQPSERPLVGNTAFNLSQLFQSGYSVLPGFVVPAIAFWEFIEILSKSELLLSDLPDSSFYVDVDNPRQLQQVAQQIRQEITAATLPPMWASSLLTATEMVQSPAMILHPSLSVELPVERLKATAGNPSFNRQPENLGILASQICLRQPEALEFSLKGIWAQLFRARSLFYWQRNRLELQQLNLAVLVQPMWEAIASGTLLADLGEGRIQATWGFGEALTTGEVLPDFYQIDIQTGTLLSSQLGSKTLAYRLDTPQDSFQVQQSGLQRYLLSQEQQQQYALEEKFLQQLITICQRLVAEISSTFSLEWTVCQSPDSTQTQLYITQLKLQPPTIKSVPSMSTQPPTVKLIRGLPAAGGRVTAPAQVLIGTHPSREIISPGRILVAQSFTPDWIPWLSQAVGIVTEQGGMTSHGAIIAREIGIPAVVGVTGVTQMIQTGELILVDGNQGEIHQLGSGKTAKSTLWPGVGDSEGKATSLQPASLPLRGTLHQPPYFPIATQLLVNLSLPNSLEKIVGLPIDGVGLLRSELIMLDALDNIHPKEWLRQGLKSELVERLAQRLVQFAAALAPRPVWYRSWDWRSHEFQLLGDASSQPELTINPVIGLRGTLSYLIDPTYFDLELTALGQVYSYGYTNLQLMLPFVRTVEEFTFCRRHVEQAKLFDNPHFQLWIMAEVPSVLFLIPDYVKAGVQGISIGSNDLTQLLLAVDRDQGQLGSSLDGRHPAMKHALKHLIQAARSAGIPCSICGQAPVQYPELIDSLVEWGITSISVDVHNVKRTYNAIARAEQRLLLEAARPKIP